jgi:hypothetical protein
VRYGYKKDESDERRRYHHISGKYPSCIECSDPVYNITDHNPGVKNKSDDKEGVYCKVSRGIVSQDTRIGSIEVDRKVTGINLQDFILDEVFSLHLTRKSEIRVELIKQATIFNYIPTKRWNSM